MASGPELGRRDAADQDVVLSGLDDYFTRSRLAASLVGGGRTLSGAAGPGAGANPDDMHQRIREVANRLRDGDSPREGSEERRKHRRQRRARGRREGGGGEASASDAGEPADRVAPARPEDWEELYTSRPERALFQSGPEVELGVVAASQDEPPREALGRMIASLRGRPETGEGSGAPLAEGSGLLSGAVRTDADGSLAISSVGVYPSLPRFQPPQRSDERVRQPARDRPVGGTGKGAQETSLYQNRSELSKPGPRERREGPAEGLVRPAATAQGWAAAAQRRQKPSRELLRPVELVSNSMLASAGPQVAPAGQGAGQAPGRLAARRSERELMPSATSYVRNSLFAEFPDLAPLEHSRLRHGLLGSAPVRGRGNGPGPTHVAGDLRLEGLVSPVEEGVSRQQEDSRPERQGSEDSRRRLLPGGEARGGAGVEAGVDAAVEVGVEVGVGASVSERVGEGVDAGGDVSARSENPQPASLAGSGYDRLAALLGRELPSRPQNPHREAHAIVTRLGLDSAPLSSAALGDSWGLLRQGDRGRANAAVGPMEVVGLGGSDWVREKAGSLGSLRAVERIGSTGPVRLPERANLAKLTGLAEPAGPILPAERASPAGAACPAELEAILAMLQSGVETREAEGANPASQTAELLPGSQTSKQEADASREEGFEESVDSEGPADSARSADPAPTTPRGTSIMKLTERCVRYFDRGAFASSCACQQSLCGGYGARALEAARLPVQCPAELQRLPVHVSSAALVDPRSVVAGRQKTLGW